jgi:mono/diheme cytochrome c family protein
VIQHLNILENLDRDDVEARPSIDESAVDGDVVDGGRAHDGNCADCPGGDRMVLLIEAELVGGPLQPVAVYSWLCCRDLPRQLLEVVI